MQSTRKTSGDAAMTVEELKAILQVRIFQDQLEAEAQEAVDELLEQYR